MQSKPSEMLRIALLDLTKCEKLENYAIDMGSWVDKHDGICYVCLAGACLTQTFKAEHFINPEEKNGFTVKQAEKISNISFALNDFRLGDIESGLRYLKLERPKKIARYFPITPYRTNNKLFKAGIRSIIKMLKKNDL